MLSPSSNVSPTPSSDRLMAMVDAYERLVGLVEEVRGQVEALNATSGIAERAVIMEMGFRITALFPALRSGMLKRWPLSRNWRVRPYHDAEGDAQNLVVRRRAPTRRGPERALRVTGARRGRSARGEDPPPCALGGRSGPFC